MNRDHLSEEDIFEAAFKLKSHEARTDYLRQVCRDDDQIERIQGLLKEGAPEASFLEKGPAALRKDDNRPPDLPDRIGDFEIVGELGRGGMGVVYRARQCSLNRLVALKVLSSGLGLTTKAIMRFKLEAEAAAKLHHTNIVPIYWTGEERRVPYYAMELIDGPSLDRVIKQLCAQADSAREVSGSASSRDQHVPDWIKETLICASPGAGKTTPSTDASSLDSSSSFDSESSYYDNLSEMMADVADALAHAHDQGVVHRDIKPANLLLSSDGRLSINDFGLARMLDQPGMTMTGELMGSPMYMSPEQITAGRLPLDHRTDIYSLGASLYECLTLTPPFPGQQRDQVLSQVIHKDPPKPRSINPRIPRDLETICLKAMEKDPDRRYQTAEQMAKDLRCFVNRHAISARRTSPLEKGIRWVRKNKAISAMACVTLLVVFIAATYIVVSGRTRQLKDARENSLMALRIGDLPTAKSERRKAEELGAEEWWIAIMDGQIDLAEGNPKQALEEFKAAEKLKPDSIIVQCLLVQGYLADGRWSDYQSKAPELRSLKRDLDEIDPETLLYLSSVHRFHDDKMALELLQRAIDKQPSLKLAHITRAGIRSHDAMNRNSGEDAEKALKELDALRSVFSDLLDNPLFRSQRLESRLAWASLCHHDGDFARAKQILDDAHKDVTFLADRKEKPLGNYNRLHYYGLRWEFFQQEEDLDLMRQVMEDAATAGNQGWIIDYFWTAYYRTGEKERIRQALTLIQSMPVRDNYVLWSNLVLLMELGGEKNRAEAQTVLNEINEKFPLTARGANPFMNGTIEERAKEGSKQDLLAALNESDSERLRVETYWGIGLRHLAEGRRVEARASFQISADSPYYGWSPRLWAAAFAERLEKEDGWPHWLPPTPVGTEENPQTVPD